MCNICTLSYILKYLKLPSDPQLINDRDRFKSRYEIQF